jgi:cyclic pyranopterin phosphate synthase
MSTIPTVLDRIIATKRAEIALRFGKTVLSKLPGHGINDPSFIQPARPMSAIGG